MCDNNFDFKLCTCVDKPVVHNKRSRRNKKKEEADTLKWTLMRYVETVCSGEIGRVIMSTKDLGEGLTEEYVLKKLNTSNCFDFDYSPQERDSLNIQVNGNWSKYLGFTFENGKWTADSNFDPFNDVMELIGKGELKRIKSNSM